MKSFKNLSIANKLAAGYFILAVLFIIMMSITIGQLNNISKAHLDVKDEAIPGIITILEIKSVFKSLMLDIHKFLLNGKEQVQKDFYNHLDGLKKHVAEYQKIETRLIKRTLENKFSEHRRYIEKTSKDIFSAYMTRNELIKELNTVKTDLNELYFILKNKIVYEQEHDVLDKMFINIQDIWLSTIMLNIYSDSADDPVLTEEIKERIALERIENSRKVIENHLSRLAIGPDSKTALQTKINQLYDLYSVIKSQTKILLTAVKALDQYKEEIFKTLNMAIKIEKYEVEISEEIVTSSINKTINIFVSAAIVFIILSLLGSLYISRLITGSVSSLLESTQKITEGDLSHQAKKTADDEIGALVDAFNKMNEKLNISAQKEKEARDQLIQSAKLETVGELAAGAAHEVKNPLAIILQGLGYLQKKIAPQDKTITLVLEQMEESVERADTIIKGLLDFAGISQLDSMEVNNLNQVLEKSLVLTKYHFNKYHVELIKELKQDLPDSKIDGIKIEQVLVNLIMNGIDAMSDGGKLYIRTYTREVAEIKDGAGFRKEDVFEPGQTVAVVEVEDNGPGIPEDALDQIFNPFFTTKRFDGGTGLGLSIVKNIVDLHKGKIRIENKKEGGVKATLLLALA